ncbi:MAG: D-alanyl-D-alanine carboxypeptidase [Lachnospiraceae bacterium]|nr:D-alanyl-D-alanine carboxypeptidase [Lachnospiraceae bacterium]
MNYKKLLKKILCIISIISYVLPVFAAAATDTLESWPHFEEQLNAKSAFVMDADSSKVLYSNNPDERLYPASLAKIMTAIIVLDEVKGNYDSLVTFSYASVTKDIDKNSVTIGASAGDQLSVKDCLYSLLLPSANDAANALAEHVAGSINDFALLMNEKAENLGLKNTHFVNPSGLHDDNQYTTASDMAKILQYAMTYPVFSQISSSISYRHAPIRKYKNPENSNNQVLNTNSIMVPGSGYYYNGITSGKTGHTSLAGYNLAASAKKNGMELICVVLGCKTDKIRYQETKALFDFHFANYQSLSIKDTDPRFSTSVGTMAIDDVDIIKGLDITCEKNAHITMPKTYSFSDVTSKLTYQVEDVYNRYAIGTVTYYLDDMEIGKSSVEGRNVDNLESIFTSYLDLSTPLSNNSPEDDVNLTANENTTHALLYINQNGNLVITKTLTTMVIVFVLLFIAVIIFLFMYTNVLSNTSFPLRKYIFRLKRNFRK